VEEEEPEWPISEARESAAPGGPSRPRGACARARPDRGPVRDQYDMGVASTAAEDHGMEGCNGLWTGQLAPSSLVDSDKGVGERTEPALAEELHLKSVHSVNNVHEVLPWNVSLLSRCWCRGAGDQGRRAGRRRAG